MQVAEIGGSDPGLASALAGANLPIDDLTEAGRTFYVFRDQGGDVLGYGGIESYGAVALLRSVVVAKDRRGQGIGVQLVNWLLERMSALGCQDIYMLTTTAVRLGENCGFQRIDRSDAPQAIRDSRQMAALCPASAVLMHRKGNGHG
jgi:N-acetylglutamate synthase-like GNAT family acetyltransferase